MTTKENLIHLDPNKQEAKVPDLNGQKPIDYGNAKHLEEKHAAEKKNAFINYSEKVKELRHETKEHLNKEQLIHNAKTKIYEKMGIDNNLGKNSPVENFLKGVIDELVIGNYDLAIEIYKTDGKVLLDALTQLSSWEGIKRVAEGLKESVVKLASGNAYEKGKSFVELGLVSTGAFAGFKIAKFGAKKMKHIDIPKQHFDKLSVSDIAKLNDTDRLEAASHYLSRELSKEEQNAIIKSHNVGESREGAGIHNYNFSEKGEKLKILENAGFSKSERKLLLEKGVCGKINMHVDYQRLIDTLDSLTSVNNLKVIDVANPSELKRFTNNLINIVTIIERIDRDLPSLSLDKQRDLIKMASITINRLDNFAIRISEAKYLKDDQKRFITQSINTIYKDKALNIRKYSGKINGLGIDNKISHMHDYHQVKNKI